MSKIEKVYNGYIFTTDCGNREIYHSIESLLERLLLYFEGKSPSFGGELYGRVIVDLKKDEPRKA